MTVFRELLADEARYMTTAIPQIVRNYGTNAPYSWLAFDASATETAYWELGALQYGSGDVTVDVIWSAATATSGVVRWEAQLMAGTPETDALNWEAEAFGTAATVDDTHLGTQAKRLMKATITLTSGALDSIANGDDLIFKLSRLGAHANDTMAGDALFRRAVLSWSET